MKKLLSILLCASLALTLLAGCKPKTPAPGGDSSSSSGSSSQSAGTPQTGDGINFTVLSGPTGVGAAKLMADNEAGATANRYNVTVAAANDEVTAALVNGSTDIAAVATNVAANLSAKTNGNVQILAVNTLGVLYILEKGERVNSVADLRGKTIYATGQGANPEYVLNFLLTENGMDPAADVDIQWMTPQEVTAQMAASEDGICMLPVPAATGLLMKDAGVRQSLSLSQAWDELGEGALAMGCVVARTEFIKDNPQAVADFLTEYQASIQYMADEANLDDAAALVARYEITANAQIAAKAIPQCNLTFLSGQEMKDTLEGYYQVLFQANPASIGGQMPYDSFYYGAD